MPLYAKQSKTGIPSRHYDFKLSLPLGEHKAGPTSHSSFTTDPPSNEPTRRRTATPKPDVPHTKRVIPWQANSNDKLDNSISRRHNLRKRRTGCRLGRVQHPWRQHVQVTAWLIGLLVRVAMLATVYAIPKTFLLSRGFGQATQASRRHRYEAARAKPETHLDNLERCRGVVVHRQPVEYHVGCK
jgi:hypothetical protein